MLGVFGQHQQRFVAEGLDLVVQTETGGDLAGVAGVEDEQQTLGRDVAQLLQ